MEDLIPFLIFVVIAVINLLKFAAEKAGKKRPTETPSGEKAPRQGPSSLEDFFEDLARKFEPQPVELPDWPEGRPRPDYLEEMEQFEAGPPEETPSAPPETDSVPVTAAFIPPKAVVPHVEPSDQLRGLKSAMRAIPATPINTRGMRIKTPPLLATGRGGQIDFPLRKRSVLREAIIAGIVFSPPRACCTSFDNTSPM